MKSIRARIATLEYAARRSSADRKLDLFVTAMSGDPAGIAQFEELRGAVTGTLHELYDAIRQPLEAGGQWPVTVLELDQERPSG